MRIILISGTCSEQEYNRLQEIKFAEKVSPQQNYFSMLVHGLNQNGVEVVCITARSIAPSNCFVKRLSGFRECVSEYLKYIYIPVIGANPGRNLNNYLQLKKIIKENVEEDSLIIFDPLLSDCSWGALAGLKFKKVRKLAVVTDLPMYISEIGKHGTGMLGKFKGMVKHKLFLHVINKMDYLCFLTESMRIINKKNVPTVLIEGMVDESFVYKKKFNNNSKKIVLYAGGLYEKFGIKTLVDAAKLIDIDGFELHLYGEGPCIEYIHFINKECPHIQYKGVVNSNEIKKIETEATLLINPRPVEEEYTKYSFPSKTMEYMASGTPLLTTKLPGIPDEYFNYVYKLNESTVDEIRKEIIDILSLPSKVLEDKGMAAQAFVIMKKNKKIQAKKIIGLIKNEGRREE